jgi:uncharacterized delta-60 repeat protein
MPARFNPRLVLTALGTLVILIAMANPAAAPPGDLDPSFDGDGKVTTDFTGGFDQAKGIAIQADGKIVAAGLAPAPGNDNFGLARYNPNGSLDLSFDGDGRVTTDFAGGFDQANAVAIQADGKIVAAGAAAISGTDLAVARYKADGSLDPSFDSDGMLTTDYGFGSSFAQDVAIQPDGKIVAAGFGAATGFDFFLTRYNSNGSLDTSFDGDGKVTFPGLGSSDNRANSVAIQGDGKIVAAGCTSCFSSSSDFALVRYNSDGSLDGSFDGEGNVKTDFAGGDDQAFALAILSDGRLVTAGGVSVSGGVDFGLARYNADGSLDMTFDGNGKVNSDFSGSSDQAYAVAIQIDGKIVTAGRALISGTFDVAVARHKTDGSLDTAFSLDGKVTTDFAGNFDQANGVAIQGDRKIVVAGFARVSGSDDFALARYTACRRTSRPSSIPICP